MKKVTAQAHSNIALVKYWGKKDDGLRLPTNSSVAIALDEAYTQTTVEFNEKYLEDEVELLGQGFEDDEVEKVKIHLDRVRKLAHIETKAKVTSKNNFPKSAGMASSASGFAALSMAAASSAGLQLSEREMSVLARNGSGSASRSIPGGISEWYTADEDSESYAEQIPYPLEWDLKVLLVMAEDTSAKKVSTTEAMAMAPTSPYYKDSVIEAEKNIVSLRDAMSRGDWSAFGKVIEDECYRLHAICMTQSPNILYWRGVTIEVFQAMYRLRERGIMGFFTVDAGPHVHVICQGKDVEVVKKSLGELSGIKTIIECGIGEGAKIIEDHLF